MNGQIAGLSAALEIMGEGIKNNFTYALMEFMRTGNLDVQSFDTVNLKASLKHIGCWNNLRVLCPIWKKPTRTCDKKIDSEGYWQVYIGVRIR